MIEKQLKAEVGVVIGRFHVHELHQAHKDLIKSVIERHPRVFVILGNSSLRNTIQNPLGYRERRAMFAEEFPDVEIFYVNDVPDDDVTWSKNVDKIVTDNLNPSQKVVLYGSRDSFIKSYVGKFTTCELESDSFISGTEIRRQVSNFYPPTKDFRAGLIASTARRYPVCYQTVDIAILRGQGVDTEVLLVRKPNCELWRFPGGFSDAKSKSLEEDAKREAHEETEIEVGDLEYVGSTLIDDPRYRNEVDKIKTAFFIAQYVFGRPQGADDVAEARWFKLTSNPQVAMLVKEHKPLYEMLSDYMIKKFNEQYNKKV